MAKGTNGFGETQQKGAFKKRVSAWFNDKLFPVMTKVGNQVHLSSIRDGFAIITPLIIAAAMGLVIRTSIFGGAGTEQSSLLGVFANWGGSSFFDAGGSLTDWGRASDVMDKLLNAIGKFGLDFIAVYFAFSFGYFLSRARGNSSPEIGGLVSLASFFIATIGGQSSAIFINGEGVATPLVGLFFDSKGLFTAIFTTIISIEIYSWLARIKAFQINMPAGVPPAIARSFSKLLPIIFTSLLMTLLLAVVAIPTYLTQADMLTSQRVGNDQTGYSVVIGVSPGAPGSFYNIGDLLYMAVQSPFIYAATIQGANLGIAILWVLLQGLFWFFGLHGDNIVSGIFGPVFLTLLANNSALLAQGGLENLKANGSIFVWQSLNYFVVLGGSGATLMLVIVTLMIGKRPGDVAVARFALPPGIFNINEPVAFGFPLVTNVRWFIPYVFLQPVMVVSTYLLYLAFDTTPVFAQVPWTLPAGLGALFATGFDYTAFLIVAINLLIAFITWGGFTVLSNRLYFIEQSKKKETAGDAGESGEPAVAVATAGAGGSEADDVPSQIAGTPSSIPADNKAGDKKQASKSPKGRKK